MTGRGRLTEVGDGDTCCYGTKEHLTKRQIIFSFADSAFPRLYCLKFSCKLTVYVMLFKASGPVIMPHRVVQIDTGMGLR